ncbi:MULTISPECIES: DUF3306 domain-containing protein [Marinobacter]|uniref:DUF3306 domain-containing protein n=1 Tax=Marinobacter xiaoshiensis TaxID=3073652 RepID=A0ABU2HDH8_9GAMM|nr:MULTISPECIES: DUF3306 domain-containing protein [unclassified Marinobacter]MBK1887960.1 DUF3306 domain-containing protein [Marinobacter sp. DY40_1A1]MDS1308611.1 DUF3306 domain-containing protein [Marinobacter sp. F60267]
MAESRLQRWSRQKAEAARQPESSATPVVATEPSPEAQELAINEALPEHEVLAKYGLPDPDAIKLGTDITGFMRKEIPDLLRRKALRALWKSNPVLAVLDGLNDYDEDFTASGPTIKGAKTLYKVGQGFIDRAKKADESIEDQAEEPAGIVDNVRPPEVVKPPKPDVRLETGNASAQSEVAVARQVKNEPNQLDESQAPRFRPRMRFDD